MNIWDDSMKAEGRIRRLFKLHTAPCTVYYTNGAEGRKYEEKCEYFIVLDCDFQIEILCLEKLKLKFFTDVG